MAEQKKVVKKKRKGVKNVRKAKKHHARNVIEKINLRLALKAARTAITAKAADALEKVKKAISIIDKAAEKKIIHNNKAARLNSRLSLMYNKLKG